jgi:hypothetical protein
MWKWHGSGRQKGLSPGIAMECWLVSLSHIVVPENGEALEPKRVFRSPAAQRLADVVPGVRASPNPRATPLLTLLSSAFGSFRPQMSFRNARRSGRGGFEAQVDRSKALLWLAAWQIMASSSLLGLVNFVPACNFCSVQLSSMRHLVAS